MSLIDIRIKEILQATSQLEKQRSMISSARGNIKGVSNSLDRKIAARRNIGGRLDEVQRALHDIEQQLKALEKFTNQSMTAYSNNERKLVSLAKKYTLSRKSVKSKNWNAFKGIKVKFTKKKQKIRQNIAKAIDIKNIFKVLSTTYIKSKVRQVYEATIKDPYSWSKRIIQLTTQQVTSMFPTHVYSKDYQMSKAQTALDAVRSTRPWVQSATKTFYSSMIENIEKQIIQPVQAVYTTATKIKERYPYCVASVTFLQKIFQSSLNKTRKTQIDTSETEELTFTTGTKKSLNSFKEIGTMIWDEHMERSDKMFDSWGDFGNAISFGIPKGIYQGLENNYNEMVENPSLRTVSNWITLGGVDMTIGAVNPDDPLSAEHWLNSMGLAGTVVGGGALSQSIKSATTTTTIKPATKVPPATKPSGNQSTQPNITNSSIDNKTVTQPKAADGNKTGSQVGTVKGTGQETYQHLKDYKNNQYFTRSVEYNAGKDGTGFTYKVYQRGDINWDMVRTKGAKKGRGLTNAEASAKYGLAPILDDAGSVATLHHSQQKGVGPLFEASTRYHNISNAKRAPLHPYKGKLNPFFPMDETTRGAFQKVDSINYWKIRGQEVLGGK
ncbi:hypothetical protein [Bacillus alkalicellulosilyticus]|uniref:hypothetical protein n=2 Tax=Alkalihalobacterium alkalicellulosilyticum TaxID=1912214 RepID=UPI001FEC61ED|nr:hypothetical protein [Bacillus alkalicellulosilyticus]